MFTRTRLLALLLGGAATLTTTVATADEAASVAMARDRFAEGVEFFDAERFEEARAAFLQAYALKPHPALLLNIGQSELRAGRYADAASRFSEYLATTPADASPERLSAERGLAESRRHVAELRPTVNVAGAELFVDERRLGHTPLTTPIFVTPGRHRVRAERGHERAETVVEARAASVHDVPLELIPAQTAVRPEASIEPSPSPDFSPPLHPNPMLQEAPPPPPASPRDVPFGRWLVTSPVGLTGLVLTGTGIALGTTGTIVATNRYSAARDATNTITDDAAERDVGGTLCAGGDSPVPQYQEACRERQSRLDQGDTWRGLAIGGFVGATAIAAGTVLYYFLDGPSTTPMDRPNAGAASPPRPRVTPWVAGDVRGLSVSGSF